MSHLYRCLAFLFAMAGESWAQVATPRVIPDEPSCARCSISAHRLVTLGADDGVGSLNGKPMSVKIDSRGRYWLFQELEPATVFNANGTVDRMVGRKGSGPGEFQSSNYGIVVGDSMLVFDWLQARATMFGPDLKPGRTIRIMQSMGDVVPVEWPSLLVMHGHIPASNPPNSVLHRISLAGPEIRILGSFGPTGTGGPMGNSKVHQALGRSRDGVWSAYWSRPQLTKWDRNGRAVSTFTRPFEWFTGDTEATLGWGRTAPTPSTGLINEDDSGLVWLFIHRPVPDWKDAWADVRPIRIGGGSEIRARDVRFDKLFTTYVEVIDPVQGRVVARHNFDGYIFEALPDRKVAQYVIDADGFPRVHIVSLALNGR
jgi:hypothetical protein